MGFFKKIFKGIGKVFKKIGRGIKKVVGKVGKFMNKIGIVGQIAMAFILPGIGNALMSGIGGIASSMVTNSLGGIGGALVKGAGHVISAAHKFVTVGKNAFNTVTQGVTKFIGEFGKTALNKIPGINIESASKNFFGKGGAWEAVQQDIVKNSSRILDPFKRSITIKKGMGIKDIMNSTGLPKDVIQQTNLGLDLDRLAPGDVINFDPEAIGSTLAGQGPLKPELQSFTGNVTDRVSTMKAESLFTDTQIKQGQAVRAFEEQFTKPIVDPTKSLLTPPDASADVTPPDPSKTFMQRAGEELKARYNFEATPLAASTALIQDAQQVQQALDPQVDLSSPYSYPQYVASGAQDYDVMAQSAPRNFGAYSSQGQYGSTSRIYDTILMNPVSTWSRDLSARYSS